ncbi:MAG: PTS sugar transporter subunit IIB [Mycoplasmataceae bacterium]|nr:PTS sugar transporter subunit IIB [Mycoplasmataceae bacterium]
MKKILLLCSAGMSTSLLVRKMLEDARKNNFDFHIEAKSMGEGKTELNNWDVILLGPQVSYALSEIKGLTAKPVSVIPSNIYGLGKGDEANLLVKKMIGE